MDIAASVHFIDNDIVLLFVNGIVLFYMMDEMSTIIVCTMKMHMFGEPLFRCCYINNS